MTDENQHGKHSASTSRGPYLARWGDQAPLYEAITRAVATVSGEARSTIASQYDRSHAVSLSHLFGGETEESTPSTGVVKFRLSEYVVAVYSDGRLSVGHTEDARSSVTRTDELLL